jgi:DNA primase small subunit
MAIDSDRDDDSTALLEMGATHTMPLINREFSYTLNDSRKTFVRHRAFGNWLNLRDAMTRLAPLRIDIGPRYSGNLAKYDRLGDALEVAGRELVFDIDMNDYDDVRFCECVAAAAAAAAANTTTSKDAVCLRCWPLMTAAIAITDAALRDQWGFTRRLWVFSGRRGVHCWVSDARAQRMSVAQRKKCLEFFNLSQKMNAMTGAHVGRVRLPERTLSAHERRSYALALPHFLHYADEQALFFNAARYRRVLELLPCEHTLNYLHSCWMHNAGAPPTTTTTTTTERWAQLCAAVARDSERPEYATRPHVIEEIVLTLVYPRFDTAVTLPLNHLLKAPFVAHPTTHRICVPIDAARAGEFNPLLVPTLEQVVGGERSLDDDVVRFIEITLKK